MFPSIRLHYPKDFVSLVESVVVPKCYVVVYLNIPNEEEDFACDDPLIQQIKL